MINQDLVLTGKKTTVSRPEGTANPYMPLEAEFNFFEANLAEWLKTHSGHFVLIKGEYYEFFDSKQEAVDHGLQIPGSEPFFIHEVKSIIPYRAATVRPVQK